LFVSRPEYAYMSGSGFLNNAQGFDTVSAYAREGGTDEAILFDSAGDDTLHASGSTFTLTTPAQFFYGELFDHVSAYSQQGGTDTLDILAVDYLLEHFGNWI